MTAGWLKRRSLLLSMALGFVSWIVLIPVWTHSVKGGLLDRAIKGLFAPTYWLADRIGALFFPDYLVPHSTGWYLVPLFATAGEIGLLTTAWYICIRIKRMVESEQIPAVSQDIDGDREPEQDEEVRLDGEDEPVYVQPAKTYSTNFGSTIDHERFKLRTWKEFRKHTGHWPLFSIAFHYSALGGMLIGVLIFLWMKDHRDWVDDHSFLIGGFGLVFFVVFMEHGNGTKNPFWPGMPTRWMTLARCTCAAKVGRWITRKRESCSKERQPRVMRRGCGIWQVCITPVTECR
jgi:hypothetical protein